MTQLATRKTLKSRAPPASRATGLKPLRGARPLPIRRTTKAPTEKKANRIPTKIKSRQNARRPFGPNSAWPSIDSDEIAPGRGTGEIGEIGSLGSSMARKLLGFLESNNVIDA